MKATTPICDFVRDYAESGTVRLHMPGHKGEALLGIERLDLTEIKGADSLFEAEGIIRQSEETAGKLFGAHSFFSTEGSSLCIRAMVYLALKQGAATGKAPVVWAGRNAHKTFLSAAALLGCEVRWLWDQRESSYLSCKLSPNELDRRLGEAAELPSAVYVTSPDYLGNVADIRGISEVCRRHGVLLAVDNAHGAYLKFLKNSQHPMDLGAHVCCDSAHKTLPALTGCAYLHLSHDCPSLIKDSVKDAMALFGSTSPSYLLLQSLDALNGYLSEGYGERLESFIRQVEDVKAELRSCGYLLCGDEPIKLTVAPKSYGYSGEELANALREKGFECEFADPDFTVMMLTPSLSAEVLCRLRDALRSLPRRTPITQQPPRLLPPERAMGIREAIMSVTERLTVGEALGRVLAQTGVGCPPAVPIGVSGEIVSPQMVEAFNYYGITECTVVAKT